MLPRSRSWPACLRLALITLGGLCAPTVSRADDWPQWLGPQRDGVWRETNLIDKFPKEGPKIAWRVPLGQGYSGPAVYENRVYVMDRLKKDPDPMKKGTLPGDERVRCIDAATGKDVWTHSYDCPYEKVSYPFGPRTTPIVEKEHLFMLGTMGDLRCLNRATGEVVWKRNLRVDDSAPLPAWGWSSNMLIDGERLIVLVGGEKQAVVAFEKTTGKPLWKALSSQEVGYAPPMIGTLGGQRQLIIWLSDVIAGLKPETGEVLWTEKHPAEGKKQMRPAVTISTPKITADMLLVSSVYDGAFALKFDAVRPKVAWRANDTFPKVPEKLPILMSTMITQGQHTYGIDSVGQVTCITTATGETVWAANDLFGGKEALFGTVFWVEAGERTYAMTDQGDLVILKLNPKGYEELGRAHIIDAVQAARGRKVVWAHPAFAMKSVFARNDQELVRVDLSTP
ncbi:MAG: PQQ-binding-like beta-propeller repeat protein [Gemmataceae bacterium]